LSEIETWENLMAVKIRLRRTGKKKEVHYRIVVAEASSAREGNFIENIGYLNPRQDPPEVRLDEEKARVWLSRGAQPTDSVKLIFGRLGLIETPWTAKTGQQVSQSEVGVSTPPAGEVAADAGTHRDDSQGAG
jgi:small subunit ribosomal protein S16